MINGLKITIAICLLFFVFLNGCTYKKTDLSSMVKAMEETRLEKYAIINILWYNGSEDKFDYFGHVYSMTGTNLYKVPSEQLKIEKRIKLTDDETRWTLIREIKGLWVASRLNFKSGQWVPDVEGIVIEAAK
jgi:hypothetical protein